MLLCAFRTKNRNVIDILAYFLVRDQYLPYLISKIISSFKF